MLSWLSCLQPLIIQACKLSLGICKYLPNQGMCTFFSLSNLICPLCRPIPEFPQSQVSVIKCRLYVVLCYPTLVLAVQYTTGCKWLVSGSYPNLLTCNCRSVVFNVDPKEGMEDDKPKEVCNVSDPFVLLIYMCCWSICASDLLCFWSICASDPFVLLILLCSWSFCAFG